VVQGNVVTLCGYFGDGISDIGLTQFWVPLFLHEWCGLTASEISIVLFLLYAGLLVFAKFF
jgi:hypothetical protein